uniref:Astrotactin 2 n=1 Tax=Pseudonaja textilis TaxID=8673 RepID=A0A670YGS1_PSETE
MSTRLSFKTSLLPAKNVHFTAGFYLLEGGAITLQPYSQVARAAAAALSCEQSCVHAHLAQAPQEPPPHCCQSPQSPKAAVHSLMVLAPHLSSPQPSSPAAKSLSFADDLLSGLGTACVAAGRTHRDGQDASLYSVIFKCLEPDGLYKFTLYAVDTRGRHSELSTITLRTACPLVDDTKAEEIADKIYNLYNGYTSGKEQQTAYNTLMEVSASMLSRVQHHYNSHYEKFGDFVWRSEDELGPRKAHLILRRLEKVSKHCSSLLRSAYIQSRTDTMPYLFCRSEEERSQGMVWYNVLKDTKITCEEKMISLLRNMYGDSKGR